MNQRKWAQVVKDLKAGNNEFLGVLFHKYQQYCVHNLQRKFISCTEEDAKDIFMDTLMIFQRNAVGDKIKQLTNAKSYLFTICSNQWKKQLRERAKLALIDTTSSTISSIPEERKAFILNAFHQLGQRCQEIIRYFVFEDLSMKDIAELMSFSSAAVAKTTKSRCWRTLVKLVKA